MSLHSASLLYPDRPSRADKEILKRYVEVFRDTLTCIHCYTHFKTIYENYTSAHPEWANSKFDFFLFVTRAHNTVNRRLNKPKPESVAACLAAFRSNTVVTSAHTYRTKYVDYLRRTWGREMSGDSMIKLGLVRELKKITEEYWNQQVESGTALFNMSANVVEFVDEGSAGSSPPGMLGHAAVHGIQIGLRGGRLQLRR